MSGDVRLVNAVEGGADPSGSLNISFGDTVRVDPAAWEPALTEVNAEAEKSHVSAPANVGWRPTPMLLSNELLLLRSAPRVRLTDGRRRVRDALPAIAPP